MAKGGSVNGKVHYYAAGGSVVSNISQSRGHPRAGGPVSVQAMTAQAVSPLDAMKRKKYGS